MKRKGFDIQDISSIIGPIPTFLNAAQLQSYTYGYVAVTAGSKKADYKCVSDFNSKNSDGMLLGAAHVFDPMVDGKLQAITFIRQLIQLPYNMDAASGIRIISYFRLRPALILRSVSATGKNPEPAPPTRDMVVARIEKWLQVVEDGLGAVRDRPILMIAPNYAAQYDLLSSSVIASHPIWLADSVGFDGKPDVPGDWKIDMWQESAAAQVGVNTVGRDFAINLGRMPDEKIIRRMTPTRFSFLAGATAGAGAWWLTNKAKDRLASPRYRYSYLPSRA